MSIYDSDVSYKGLCETFFDGDEDAMRANMGLEEREDLLRIRFADYGSDAPYFAEIVRRNEAEVYRRELIEYQLRGAVTQAVALVLDEYLPRPEYDTKDLYGEEDDLDARVMMSEARDEVERRVQENVAAGFVPPSYFVRKKWYQEELDRLSEEYKRTILAYEEVIL